MTTNSVIIAARRFMSLVRAEHKDGAYTLELVGRPHEVGQSIISLGQALDDVQSPHPYAWCVQPTHGYATALPRFLSFKDAVAFAKMQPEPQEVFPIYRDPPEPKKKMRKQ